MTNSFAVKIEKKLTQKTLELLDSINYRNKNLKLKQVGNVIIIPLQKNIDFTNLNGTLNKLKIKFEVTSENFLPFKKSNISFKERLKDKLTKKEFSSLITSFNIIGDIAVIEIPKILEKKEKIIANALMQSNNAIKVVCKKSGITSGKFRVYPVKVLLGENRTVSIYKESGCKFKVDIAKVFFSPRLATERMRIAKQIKGGEIVGVFFAGVGPFPIVFALNSKMKKAFAIELNSDAFKLLEENIKLNSVQEKVEAIMGDVKRIVPKKLKEKCDRVVMPLPKNADLFLNEAIVALKPKGGIIHFDLFVEKDKPFENVEKLIKKIVSKHTKKFKILRQKKIRDFSPSIIQIGIDFKVYK